MGDFLFEVGVDLTKADADLQAFITRTAQALGSLKDIKVNTADLQKAQGILLAGVNDRRSAEEKLQTAQKQGDELSLNRETRKAAALKEQIALREKLNALNGAMLPGQVRQGGQADFSSTVVRNTSALNAQRDSWDMLNRIAGNTVFKFIEYEVIMAAFNRTIQVFTNSLKEASDVQLEQVLQKLYGLKGGQQGLNEVLAESIKIAKAWGSDITDVVQVAGLWTKVTHDNTAALFLANEAEKIRRASGMDTQEVFRNSVALATQLGLKLNELPHVYDQIAEAALRLAVPMKTLGTGNSMEAMKDLFTGLSESAATMKAMGFSDPGDKAAGAIAVVANQVQALGENGKEAAKNLTSMLAALEGRGPHAGTMQDIVGKPSEIHSFDDLITRLKDHSEELFKAYKQGDLGVRPQQYETLQTFLASLDKIKKIYDDIQANSKGKLNLIAESEMQTFDGQVARLKTGMQALELAIGQQLLPTMSNWVRLLNGSVLPALSHNAAGIVAFTKAAIEVGAAFLILQGISKVTTLFQTQGAAVQALQIQYAAQAKMAQLFAGTELGTVAGLDSATAAMERQKLVLATLKEQMAVAEWQTKGLATEAKALGVSEEFVAEAAGVKAVSGLEAMGAAALATGVKIGKALGPMAALLAIMTALDSKGRSGNTEIMVRDSLRNQAGATDFLSMPADFLHFMGGNAEGRGKDFTQENVNAVLGNMRRQPGVNGQRVRELFATYDKAVRSGDKARAAEMADKLGKAAADYVSQENDKPQGIAMTQAAIDAMNQRLATGAHDSVDYTKPPGNAKTGGSASEQQIAAEGINSLKRAAMALASQYKDTATAAKDFAAAQKTLAETYGYTAKTQAAENQAYFIQEQAVVNVINSTQAEIDALKKKRDEIAKLAATHPDHNSKVWQGEEKAISMANAAIAKATGALHLYSAQLDVIEAQRVKAQAAGDVQLALQAAGHDILTHRLGGGGTFGQVGSFATIPGVANMALPATVLNSFKDYDAAIASIDARAKSAKGSVSQMYAAIDAEDQLKVMETALMAHRADLVAQYGKDSPFLAEYDNLVRRVSASYNAQATAAENARVKTEDYSKSVRDFLDKVSTGNTAAIADLLHIDKSSVDYADGMAQGYAKIADERDQLLKQERNYGPLISQEQRDQLALAYQQVAEQEALLPLIEQEKALRESIYYKATESVLASHGTTAINVIIDKAFGGKADETGFKGMLADWTKQVMKSWWDTTAQKMTDALFGSAAAKHEADLKALYTAHVDGATSAANRMKEAADEQLQAAQIMAGAASGGASPATPGQSASTMLGVLQGPSIAPWLSPPSSSDTAATQQAQADAIALKTQSDTHVAAATSTATDVKSMNNFLQSGGFSDLLSQSMLLSLLPLLMGAGGGGAGIGGIAALLSGGGAALSGLSGMFKGAPGSGFNNTQTTMQILGQGMSEAGGIAAGYNQGGLMGGALAGISAAELAALLGASGPVGLAIGAAVGIGSLLFGGNHDNVGSMPDKYDPQNFDNALLEMLGNNSHASGYITPPNPASDPFLNAIMKADGGKPEGGLQFIQNWLKNFNPTTSNAQEKALYQSLLPQFGTTGNGQLTFNPNNIGQEQVVGGSLSGSYTDLANATKSAADAIIKMTAATNGALAPLMSITAVGGGPGYAADPYNIPGMNNAEFKAMVKTRFATMPQSYYQPSFYSTPGVGPWRGSGGWGGDSRGVSVPSAFNPQGQGIIVVQSLLTLNGDVLAKAVNAVNLADGNRYNQYPS